MTFLFTDIEGSTQLLERLRGRYADLLAEHRRILRSSFASWHGHEVDTQGDSFFVAFSRATDTVACAVDAQRMLSGADWPDGVDVRVRMGIHTGEPLVAGTDYVGMEVHRAARIAAVGHGGQILVSGTTHDLVVDDLPAGVSLTDVGTHRLRGMRRDTRLYQLVGEGLSASFEPLVTTRAEEPPPTPGEPPYRGLQAFEATDADLFFGRDEIVAQLLQRVRGARFLAIIGASGSGKSSILRAGLIPALRTDGDARILLMTPTSHPLEELASVLEPDAPASRIAQLVDELRNEPRTLTLELRRTRSRDKTGTSRTFIAIDQLEEVFTLCRDESERQAFLSALTHASGIDEGAADTQADHDRSIVVVTLRADFYAFLAPFDAIRSAAAASQMYVGAMSADELRQAIEEPARRGGWDFTPGLVDLLLRDVGDEPGALPLLSHALLETWKRRRGTTMTLRSYGESGEVKGAIARTADRVYDDELSATQQRIARDVFIRLTELGEGAQDTRRRAKMEEILPSSTTRAAEVRAVIGTLADARLITVSEDSVEVAHEALIREWPALREWLRTDREGLRVHRRITDAAADWEVSGNDESLLFRGARLAQARESTEYTGVLSPLEQRFLDASIAVEQRDSAEREAAQQREIEAAQALAAEQTRRANEAAAAARGLRRRALLLTGVLVLAAVLAGVAVVLARQSDANAALAAKSAQEAQDNAQLAEQRAAEARDNQTAAETQSKQAQAERLGADATQILVNGREPELAALLALAGLNTGYTVQADAALQRAARQIAGSVFEHDADVLAVAVTPNGRTLLTAAGGNVHIWDAATGSEISQVSIPSPDDPEESYWQMELSDDGTTLLAWGYVGPAALWHIDPERPAELTQISAGCEALDSGEHALSGDGRVVLRYDEGQVLAWRMPECQVIGPPIAAVDMNDPALSADGTRVVASVFQNSVLGVWDLASGQPAWPPIEGWLGNLWHPSFSRDGAIVSVGMFDGTAHTFDALTGAPLKIFRGHSDGVEHADVTADGFLVTSSLDGTARIWDLANATEIRRFVMSEPIRDAAMANDGVRIFTASENDSVREWSAGGEDALFKAGEGEVSSLSFSPDGTRLASTAGENTQVFDVSTGSGVFNRTTPGADEIAFSPDGDRLLSISGEGIALRDSATGEPAPFLAEFGPDTEVGGSAATFSADGSSVLAPFPVAGSQVAVYDTATGERRPGAIFTLDTAVLSRDGALVAGWDIGRYSIYDATSPSGQSIDVLGLGEKDGQPVSVQLNADSSHLITGDHDHVVRVRDIATWEVLLEMRGHGAAIREVRVSADDRYVLSAGDDGGARLWSLETGELMRYFPGHDSRTVTAIAISADSKMVAIGSADGTVLVTPVSLNDLETEVCDRLRRDLAEDERVAYGIGSTEAACP